MSQWVATQTSDSSRGPTAAELLMNVRELIEQPQFSGKAQGRVPFSEETKQYTEIIISLSDMLSQFPKPSVLANKKEMELAISLANLSLEAVEQISKRMEGVLLGQELNLMAKLLGCLAIVDDWDQKPEVDLNKLQELRQHTLRVVAASLSHRLEESFVTERNLGEPFEVFEDCMQEIMTTIQEITQLDNSNYPINLLPFNSRLNKISPIQVNSPHHAHIYAITLLQTLTVTLQVTKGVPLIFTERFYQAHFLASDLLGTLTKTPDTSLRSLIYRLLTVMQSLLQISRMHAKLIQPSLIRLLTSRLHLGGDISWNDVDKQLADLLALTADVSVLAENNAKEIAVSIITQPSPTSELQVTAYAYLSHCAKNCSRVVLEELKALSDNQPPSTYVQTLCGIIQCRLQGLGSETKKLAADESRAALSVRKIRSILNIQIGGINSNKMDLDNETWQEIIINQLTDFFQSISPSDLTKHVEIAQLLLTLPSDLVEQQEQHERERIALDLLPLYWHAAPKLLRDDLRDDTIQCWKITYRALSLSLRDRGAVPPTRITQGYTKEIARLCKKGISHKSRPVRIAAGRALLELYRSSQDSQEPLSIRQAYIINPLKEILNGHADYVKETCLNTLGWIGEIANPDSLMLICLDLVHALGNPNPVLRGVAFLRLSDIAKREKSPYNLIAPAIHQIGPYIASNCVTQPYLLNEFCRFISYPPASFFSQTLLYYLPQLVCECALEELSLIAHTMETTPVALVVENPAEVLEAVFLLKSNGATEQALQFLTRLLPRGKGSDQPTLGIVSLIKSRLVSLLGRIVVHLGDKETYDVALSAIHKVESLVTHGNFQGIADSRNLTLHRNIMGIISHLNNDLQDVHGKRPIEAKRKTLRGISQLILLIGDSIAIVSPQLTALLQNTVMNEELTESTFEAWYVLATVLKPTDFAPYLAVTSAIFVKTWASLNRQAKSIVKRTLSYILSEEKHFGIHLGTMASLEGIDDLRDIHESLLDALPPLSLGERLEALCSRILDMNPVVSLLAVKETIRLVSDHSKFHPLIKGDTFDPAIGYLIKALQTIAGREGDLYEPTRLAAFECLGVIGAVDPDRFEVPRDHEDPLIIFSNLNDEKSAQTLAIYFICNSLAPIFPKTSDIKFQSQLAYTIQELLGFCKFTDALVTPHNQSVISVKVRNRWKEIPDDIQATIAPLLSSKFTIEGSPDIPTSHPIYSSALTYKDWIQRFTSYLISCTTGVYARQLFGPFRALLTAADVQVLLFIMPHLVMDILSGGVVNDLENIRQEIISVLEDQVTSYSVHSADMKTLCAQTIFTLMDHLNKHLRHTGPQSGSGKHQKRSFNLERRKMVEALTKGIDNNLMAQAALKCKQYARALMNLEQRVIQNLASKMSTSSSLQADYEKMHEIYAHLDEPDGMNGISSRVFTPSLEHQIREHESNGRWTAAQSCWEVRLQQNPDEIESHIGLLRCLRNLGHFDTLRTHLAGVLTRDVTWSNLLEPFRLEGAWTANDWETVEQIVLTSNSPSPQLSTAKVLLAFRRRDYAQMNEALVKARSEFGQPIGAAGSLSYRRTYEANLHLHILEDLSLIAKTMTRNSQATSRVKTEQLFGISNILDARYASVMPSYRTQEPILSIRRTVIELLDIRNSSVDALIGQYWLASSKIARKAGHFQAAYSALLQGRRCGAPYHFIQGCKLLQSTGDSIRALQELNNALALTNSTNNVIDLTEEKEASQARAKPWLLRARWMQASERFSRAELNEQFSKVTQLVEKWEPPFFYWALYLDRSQIHKDVPTDQLEEYVNHIDHVVRHYGMSLRHGSKHLYQTVPRMLTLWLNLGQREELKTQRKQVELLPTKLKILTNIQSMSTADHAHRPVLAKFGSLCDWIRDELVPQVDPFKWLTAFPQLVSRLVNDNNAQVKALFAIIGKVIGEFPQQSLWIITGVSASGKKERREAALRAMGFAFRDKHVSKHILSLSSTEMLADLRERCRSLALIYSTLNKELLDLCNFDVGQSDEHYLSVKCENLPRLDLSNVIVPLQDSFTTPIPPMSSQFMVNQSFPHALPTIAGFNDKIIVMPSLQKPRKIGITASNGENFSFLCKPKDDLRKDARLMDFNSVVNKLLRANSESRRRQLHIRTYSVVPLNEECGLIEWVRNTIALRAILRPRYDALGVGMMPKRTTEYFERFKSMQPEQAGKSFESKVLPDFKPLFHEWLLETFPEPTAWFASRLAYSRTAAVISMVGYIIGLGDRHCENIMLDEGTGETVHCDFNCLFDKGKQFEIPELVPFRLTQNIVDGMGVTGVEGCFRISCEITLQMLRSNQDCLMSVLEAFIHDPLVEWEDERRRKERRRDAANSASVDLRKLALGALNPIERKLQGIETGKQISVSNQVEKLIQEARSSQKLAKMYVGWCSWIVRCVPYNPMCDTDQFSSDLETSKMRTGDSLVASKVNRVYISVFI
ncbi:hypothetical protein CPB86DRAFT_749052 [Serendipita vermifera]|nr:hypothetical protein CPB86DRAFT_749052 [Serendipita vermifera]